jgi:hypothetical protein
LWVDPPEGAADAGCPELTTAAEIERLTQYVPYVERGVGP